jgi:CHAD domain-containing protein
MYARDMPQAVRLDILDSVDLETYIEISERNIQRVSNRLDDYIKEPNEERIHDIRTAIRRLEATYLCLPKNLRKKKKIEDYVRSSKALFRINSEVRDCDIILEKLSIDAQISQQNVFKSFERSLQRQRRTKLDKALSIASQLRNLSIPNLSKKNISQKRLKKRFGKVVSKFVNRIEKNFPLIISDSKKITELHELRKDCKKLRYVLELLPDKSKNMGNKTYDNDVSQLIEKLEKIQDMLGTIHDYDTTVAYLKGLRKGTKRRRSLIQQMIEKMTRARQSRYEEFVQHFKGYLTSKSLLDSKSYGVFFVNV